MSQNKQFKNNPSPGTWEKESSYKFSTEELQGLVDPKNLTLLGQFGGTSGIVQGLKTNPELGLSSAEASGSLQEPSERQKLFGQNRLPPAKSKSIWELLYKAIKDKTLILLSIGAIISLSVGIYEDVGTNKTMKVEKNGNIVEIPVPKLHFVEGLAILVAVAIVVIVSSVNDYKKEKQFQKLNSKKEEREIKVTRDGKIQLISIFDLVVGDVVHMEPGDIIAADGIVVSSHNLHCDESSATGETDAITKIPYEDILKSAAVAQKKASTNSTEATINEDDLEIIQDMILSNKKVPFQKHTDPFILSGSSVLEGVGEYIVTSVGESSFFGKILMNLRTESKPTPLQKKLAQIASRIAKVGISVAIIFLITRFAIYFANWSDEPQYTETQEIVDSVMKIFVSFVLIIVVVIPEGLPLAVTISLAFATVRMLKDNNLVRVLAACETMGGATTVCSDKTGTLTQNKMTVVVGTVGTGIQFRRNEEVEVISAHTPQTLEELKSSLPPNVLELLIDGISCNSSAFESKNEAGVITFQGSKTECALLGLTYDLGSRSVADIRHHYPVVQVWPFSSARKTMSVIVKVTKDKKVFHRLLIKGASEIVLAKCDKLVEVRQAKVEQAVEPFDEPNFATRPIDPNTKTALGQRISEYANQSLRTIGLAMHDIFLNDEELEKLENMNDEDEVTKYWEEVLLNKDNLTLIGIVGIEDPLREGVTEAVSQCRRAGVVVRMVTGDNVLTAKAIAKKCGIYQDGAIVMEGPDFRKLSEVEMDAVLPRLRVLARSSPEDKMKMVMRLKHLGQTVAVTGDGTNDGPALKVADVGFSMGIAGTEVAKEASSIILMDDNFASIVKAIVWGRMVNESIKKFLQFQLTVNISAVIVTFVTAVVDPTDGAALSAIQLLWINLIMNTFAALALATDPPNPDLLNRPPDSRKAGLITPTMWKMIIGQALFQLIAVFSLLYGGSHRFKTQLYTIGYKNPELRTMVFNTFVWMQLFNEISSRNIDNKLNCFRGIHKNAYFIVIWICTAIAQVIIVQFGEVVFNTVALSGTDWAICLAIGFLSLPIGVAIRLIPTEIFTSLQSTGLRRFESIMPHSLSRSQFT
jgi:Ca2+-transporting ATPase